LEEPSEDQSVNIVDRLQGAGIDADIIDKLKFSFRQKIRDEDHSNIFLEKFIEK
jgi:hypothetical protein